MSRVVWLRAWKRRHERASAAEVASSSAARRACIKPKASNVSQTTPRFSAVPTSADQCSAGIDVRAFQELTVDGLTPSATATEPVPPNASIAESTVRIMGDELIRNLRSSQEFASCSKISAATCGQFQRMLDPQETIAARLVALRQALKLKQSALCKKIGVTASTYSPFETGERRISLEVASRLRDRFAVPLDWIYCGDPSMLPSHLDDAMTTAKEEERAEQRAVAKATSRSRKVARQGFSRFANFLC